MIPSPLTLAGLAALAFLLGRSWDRGECWWQATEIHRLRATNHVLAENADHLRDRERGRREG